MDASLKEHTSSYEDPVVIHFPEELTDALESYDATAKEEQRTTDEMAGSEEQDQRDAIASFVKLTNGLKEKAVAR